jgi:hypothetical protein
MRLQPFHRTAWKTGSPRVIKLAGAALVASALGFVGAREADAAAIET